MIMSYRPGLTERSLVTVRLFFLVFTMLTRLGYLNQWYGTDYDILPYKQITCNKKKKTANFYEISAKETTFNFSQPLCQLVTWTVEFITLFNPCVEKQNCK